MAGGLCDAQIQPTYMEFINIRTDLVAFEINSAIRT